jgi:hypothetical protein
MNVSPKEIQVEGSAHLHVVSAEYMTPVLLIKLFICIMSTNMNRYIMQYHFVRDWWRGHERHEGDRSRVQLARMDIGRGTST